MPFPHYLLKRRFKILQMGAWVLLCFALATACEPLEERLTDDPSISLHFSQDTVYFDTVLTTVGSITKRFRVYNPSPRAIDIGRVAIGRGAASFYTITINGEEKREATKVRLLGNDSLLILVKVNIDPGNRNLPFIVQDSVVFETNGRQQDVKLVSWGQDAHFLRDSVLDCNAVWEGTKPYVVYGRVLVDSLCTLNISAGTTVYMHNGAEMFVRGSLRINGTPEKQVQISSVRQDAPYDRTPGQWGAIVFLNGSSNNAIKGARISNGVFGLYTDLVTTAPQPIDLAISQSIIENMSYAGVWSLGGKISLDNVLINNCLTHAVACLAGGNYQFNHCTLANYSFDFFREEPLAVFSNFILLNENTLIGKDLSVELKNSIIWGSLEEEVLFPKQWTGADSLIAATNCFIKTKKTGIFRSKEGTKFYIDPKFKDPRKQLFMLDTLSPAKDAGLLSEIVTDLLGKMRDTKPDVGAYERLE